MNGIDNTKKIDYIIQHMRNSSQSTRGHNVFDSN